MSNWCYIFGTIRVSPFGRTQAEKTYILQTVLDHLPVVSGSEGDMEIHMIQEYGYNATTNADEFGYSTNNLRNRYGCRDHEDGLLYTQDYYLLTLSGDLRDREFERTYKEFINWLCRLSKRVCVSKILVEIRDSFSKSALIQEDSDGAFSDMFELPSWSPWGDNSKNWCEYLMWKDTET